MLRNYYQGTMITVELPKNQYRGYVVDCIYRYVKDMNKYALSMWLRNTEVDDRMQICSQEINTQYITSTRENIKKDVCAIIEQAANSSYFDKSIETYEYTQKCFERGNAEFENEENRS